MTFFTAHPGTCRCLAILSFLLIPVTGSASETIVTPDWVAERIQNPGFVLLHVGERETFDKGHLHGARHVNGHRDFSHPDSHSEDSLTLELPSISQLESTLEELGVSENSKIVVYWSDDEITDATRVIFTLQWAGLGAQTYYLDGGLEAWKAAGFDLSKNAVTPDRGSLALTARNELVVDAEWVRENVQSDGVAVVDGRSRAFFDGVSASRGKEGHIAGAGSTPWTDLVDHDLKLADATSIRESFSRAGVKAGDTVVAYCHIGQYATMVMLAASTIGHEVKLYDGAFQDWAVRDLPVTTE